MRQLDIRTETIQDVTVVNLDGSIDASTIEHFLHILDPLCNRPLPKIILDCANLSYASSNYFGVLAKYHNLCRNAGGRLILCAVQRKLLFIIETLGLNTVLTIVPNREEALQQMQK